MIIEYNSTVSESWSTSNYVLWQTSTIITIILFIIIKCPKKWKCTVFHIFRKTVATPNAIMNISLQFEICFFYCNTHPDWQMRTKQSVFFGVINEIISSSWSLHLVLWTTHLLLFVELNCVNYSTCAYNVTVHPPLECVESATSISFPFFFFFSVCHWLSS